MSPVRVEQLPIPAAYGSPSVVLDWSQLEPRIEAAQHYWLATVRPDGRPHVVPLDGLWVGGDLYFGGSPTTVRHRNLVGNGQAVMHLEDATSAVIVEGACAVIEADAELAETLSTTARRKYGYGQPPETYRQGVWRLRPTKVVAWTDLTRDATRFTFG